MKKISCIFFILVSTLAITNLVNIFTDEVSFNLKFADVEARAWSEDQGGSELRIGYCDDGIETFTSCEWDEELSNEDCTMSDERDCSPGNNPLNPDTEKTDNLCAQYGHNYYYTICFEYCTRCSHTRSLCND